MARTIRCGLARPFVRRSALCSRLAGETVREVGAACGLSGAPGRMRGFFAALRMTIQEGRLRMTTSKGRGHGQVRWLGLLLAGRFDGAGYGAGFGWAPRRRT